MTVAELKKEQLDSLQKKIEHERDEERLAELSFDLEQWERILGKQRCPQCSVKGQLVYMRMNGRNYLKCKNCSCKIED